MQIYSSTKSLTVHILSLLVIPHFAQNVEYSVNTLAKDPHGDVDEAQFIDASKLVRKDLSKFKPLIPHSYCISLKSNMAILRRCYRRQYAVIVNHTSLKGLCQCCSDHTSLKGLCQCCSDFCSVTLCAMLSVSQQNSAQFALSDKLN